MTKAGEGPLPSSPSALSFRIMDRHEQLSADSAEIERQARIGMNASWAVNIVLLGAKIAAFVISQSYSVLASAIDSVVDLLSQAFVALASRNANRWHPNYPTGRSRLETIAVLACAMIMSCATVLVIRECIGVLVNGLAHGDLPGLNVGISLYCIIGGASVLKLALWLYCRRLSAHSLAMLALAEDHWNDVVSNIAGIIGPTIAFYVPKVWWLDATGGILISLYILYNWYQITQEQVSHIVGITAPTEFVDEVKSIVESHYEGMTLDRVLAYHFGQRYMVEIEVVMSRETTLQISHDVAMELQHKVEGLDNVERAYVHVDYEMRDYLEHKVERTLLLQQGSASTSNDLASPRGETTGLRHRGVAETYAVPAVLVTA